MRPKACTKCRQWKARCDAVDGEACSRCRSLNLPCVFDASFKRVSKVKRLQQMSSEIEQLRQAMLESSHNNSTASAPETDKNSDKIAITVQSEINGPGTSEMVNFVPTPFSSHFSTDAFSMQDAPLTIPEWSLGTVGLTSPQVERHFKTYFARHHQCIPFRISSQSPDVIFSRSPLLFWVICSVTSSWKQQNQLAPIIKSMIAETLHEKSHSIETIQALTIMSIRPFKITHLSEDPSSIYGSIIAHMGLQLGLHRAGQAFFPLHHINTQTAIETEIKVTTWLASYVVCSLQSSYLGVPPSMIVDSHLLIAIENPSVNISLAQLCRVCHLMMEFCLEIGVNAPTPTGLLQPAARLIRIDYYDERLSTLEQQHLAEMEDTIKVSFLYTKLQLYSFALLEDISFPEEVTQISAKASSTACEIIELCDGMNLALAPFHIRRAMCYAAFVLTKIVRSSSSPQRELLLDSIERARQALSTTASTPDDIIHKACSMLQDLPYLEDKHRSPSILTRMGASIFYDTLRIQWENWLDKHVPTEEISLDVEEVDWDTILNLPNSR